MLKTGILNPHLLSLLARSLQGIRVTFEPHGKLRKRVPRAIGLIRTGDTIRYANILIESA